MFPPFFWGSKLHRPRLATIPCPRLKLWGVNPCLFGLLPTLGRYVSLGITFGTDELAGGETVSQLGGRSGLIRRNFRSGFSDDPITAATWDLTSTDLHEAAALDRKEVARW